MHELFFNPYFGLILTLACGSLFWRLQRFKKLSWINPLLFSVILIIGLLESLHIPYEAYRQGADIIHLFLGPITVLLAVPLYEHRDELLRHKLSIFTGTVLGSLSALISVFVLGHLFGLSDLFINSLLPKSTTTPIGISASEMLEGIVGLSVLSIVITGIFGALIAPLIFKVLRIKSSIAKGIALGTTSHAVGTAKAYEIDRLAGGMSGLSIGLAGIISIIWIILLLAYLH
jgi:putative effector of murein hydrolase